MKGSTRKIQKIQAIFDDDYNEDDEGMDTEEDTSILGKGRKVVRIKIPSHRQEGSSTKMRKGSASIST